MIRNLVLFWSGVGTMDLTYFVFRIQSFPAGIVGGDGYGIFCLETGFLTVGSELEMGEAWAEVRKELKSGGSNI